MANVNLPAPVAFAGAALCALGGYLIGVVAGPDTTSRTTAEVVSYDADSHELCLTGDAVADLQESDDGRLCGTWRSAQRSPRPQEGDQFRFVVMSSEGQGEVSTFIYGDVVE
ncbi:MAG TPA: hypothetical protein VFG72_17890 [Marmoricola sp.]|nr:hypothetical protein [Marmoricola sp.]